LVYDGKAQPLQVVALDGVPIGSQDGRRQGKLVTRKHILLPAAARAEFLVKGPSAAVEKAIFRTVYVDTGAIGGSDPTRPLASIMPSPSSTQLSVMPVASTAPAVQRFEDLSAAKVTGTRTLYFSENLYTNKPDQFFITVVGQKPKLFSPDNPPAIVTDRGAVEDWTINNPTFETHVFHIHQIHFQLLSETINGAPVPISLGRRQFLDSIAIPHGGSATVRMDFRGSVVGDFVYHCHILGHEDLGMMAIIRVQPPS
jgi:FtsP/CotA-like multicopper oxidase with cupredoxin domain